MAEPQDTSEQKEERSTGEWTSQPGGGRATRGPEVSGEAEVPWEGEDDHGWAPDAPGTGEAKERTIEGHQKAFHPDDTQAESKAPEGGFDVKPDPAAEGVGVSTTRRGEDVMEEEGKEPGRYDTGTQGPSQRPTGESTARDSTGVDPQEPQGDAPTMPSGDQGG